ncbi:MAG: hypothetical protein U1D67_04235 [Dehalococcoidia bacterium]|nr:hypothetical protein [Dehalococcoidia bacterium]
MRDGVWELDGLRADFRLIRHGSNIPWVVIETAGGEHYAREGDLKWDIKKEEVKNA